MTNAVELRNITLPTALRRRAGRLAHDPKGTLPDAARPSGCGKTTILRSIAGLVTRSAARSGSAGGG
jgi:ABC-type iron transport system FetAB ATPase subunit